VTPVVFGKPYWSHFLVIHTTYDCIATKRKITA
jgi:hypothetical protein